MRVALSFGLVSILVLSACGGSSDSGGTTEQPVNLATITPANAPQIAAATLAAAMQTDGLSEFTGIAAPTAPLNDPSQLALTTLGEIQRASTAQLKQGAQTATLTVTSDTVECALSGSVTVTVDIADGSTLSEGDSITADYAACIEQEGIVINGSFSMTIDQMLGDLLGDLLLLDITVQAVNFSVTEGGETATVNGTLSMAIDTRNAPVTTVTVSTPSLSVSNGATSQTLVNFSSMQTIDPSSTTYEIDLSGSLRSSAFEGQVNFESTAALESFGDGFVLAGEILITGAQEATIRIIINADIIVLEVDSDGVDGVDETIEMSWEELLSAA